MLDYRGKGFKRAAFSAQASLVLPFSDDIILDERFCSLLLSLLSSFFQHLAIRHKHGTAAPARCPRTGLPTPPLPLAVAGLLGGCCSYPCLMPQGPAEMVPFSQALLPRPPSLGVSGPTKFPTGADSTVRVLQFVILGDCRSASLLPEQWCIL